MEGLPGGTGTPVLEQPNGGVVPLTAEELRTLQQHQGELATGLDTVDPQAETDPRGQASAIEPHTPRTDTEEEDLVVGIAGTGHDARLYAKDAGHERHLNHLEEKTGVHRIARKIWANVSSGARKHRFNLEARQEIESNDSGNVLMHHGVSDEEWGDMARDTITRFTSEYDTSLLDTAAGEHKAEISDLGDPNAVAIRSAVKELIKGYADGRLDDDSFNEEKKRMLANLADRGITKDLLGEGASFADNLHDIAKAVVRRIGNERSAVSADEVIDNLKFVVGEARIGSRTEASKNAVERLSDKLNCKWINETTAVAAASTIYAIGRWSTQRATSTALRFGFVGVGSGLWAGIRARSESKSERTLLAREHSMGIERDTPTSKQEQKLVETLHDSKNARDIIGDVSSLFDTEGKLSVESPDDIRDVTALLSDVRARQLLSGRNKIDLIDYSDIKTSAAERLELMKLTAQLQTQLASKFNALSDTERRELSATGNFDGLLTASNDAAIGTLSESVSEKDALARRLHNAEFAKGFVKGTVLGMAFGEVAQEVTSLIRPDEQGVIEALSYHGGGSHHDTLAAAATAGNEHHAPALSGATEKASLFTGPNGAKTDMTLPKEFAVHKGPDGFTVTSPNGHSVSGVTVDSHGQLTPQSLQEMKSIGLDPVSQQPVNNPIEHITTNQTDVSANQFVNSHAAETTHVSRVDFASNGTSTPDGNELRLDLGANNGVDAQGNVVLTMHGMTNGESVTSGGQSINPQSALQEGKLSAYISVDRGSQSTPFKVPIRPDGSIVIAQDSPLRQMFTSSNGQFQFKGGFIEVAQNNGAAPGGVERITPLATVVGSNQMDKFHDLVQTKTSVPNYHYSFQPVPSAPTPVEAVAGTPRVDVPPVLPFYYRNTIRPRSEQPAQPVSPSLTTPAPVSTVGVATSVALQPDRPGLDPASTATSTPITRASLVGSRATAEEEPAPQRRQQRQPRAINGTVEAEQPSPDEAQATNDTPADDTTQSQTSTPPSDDTSANQTGQADEAPEQPEWEEGDEQRTGREMALKFGFPFIGSVPYRNRWNSAVWARATELLQQTMASAQSGAATGRTLSKTISALETDATGRGEDLSSGNHRSSVDAGVQQLLTEVLSTYRKDRKQSRAA